MKSSKASEWRGWHEHGQTDEHHERRKCAAGNVGMARSSGSRLGTAPSPSCIGRAVLQIRADQVGWLPVVVAGRGLPVRGRVQAAHFWPILRFPSPHGGRTPPPPRPSLPPPPPLLSVSAP